MRCSARFALLSGLWLLPGNARGQAVIEGRVTDQATGQALGDATVQAADGQTTRSAANGRYRLSGLPTGKVQIRAIHVGFAAASVVASIADSGVTVVDFQLRAKQELLDRIVITATGRKGRLAEIGANIGRIEPDSLVPAAIQSFSDVITARAAGLSVLHSGGSSGIGSRVRIRGSNSLALSNEPLYVVDGIRLDNSPTTFRFPLGDESPSRLDDIDQEFLQTVDVVKGSAASTLYGSAAANGVIQLETRHGTAGSARWTSFIEGGAVTQATRFPANYGLWTRSNPVRFPPVQGMSGLCTLVDVADGRCAADSVARFNPLLEKSPFGIGYRMKVGLTVSGGAPALTYFAGADGEREVGVYSLNDLNRLSAHTNMTTSIGSALELSIVTSYLHRELGVPQNGFTLLGPIVDGLNGWPFSSSIDSMSGKPTFGYKPVGPDQFSAIDYTQRTEHLTSGAHATWRAKDWLTVTGMAGLDHVRQRNRGLVDSGRVDLPDYNKGRDEENPSRLDIVTLKWSATAQAPPAADVRATFTGGTEWVGTSVWEKFSTNATGPISTAERGAHHETLGAIFSSELAWRDRRFLTGALRSDWSGGFRSLLYPSLSASWILSDEPFFPRPPWLGMLRLRGAWGQSGRLPGATDAMTLLRPVTVPIDGVEVATVTAAQLRNPDLKSERVSEAEAGLDAEMAGGRVGVQATYYGRKSRDALVLVPLAGSIGSAAAQLQNVGVLRNEGVELMLNVEPIRSHAAVWNFSLALSGNRNRVVSLRNGVTSIDVTAQQRLVAGYPAGGFWATPADSVVDVNGDGLISRNEVVFSSGKPQRFIGSPLPTRSVTLTTSLAIAGRARLWSQFDYEGGQHKYDFTERLRCQLGLCEALSVADAPLAAKAKAAEAYAKPSLIYDYIEDASFAKWRELGIESDVPRPWSTWAHVASARLSLAVRNLATWTRYPGLDPETSRSQDNFRQVDYYTQPQVRHIVARLSLGF